MSGLKVAHLTDIHLGTRQIANIDLIRHLRVWIDENTELIKDCDLFVISGDVFDRDISLMNPSTFLILDALYEIAELCADNDVLLHILNGTISHDYNQSKIFLLFARALKYDRIVYIDTICLKIVKGYNIIYIPDNMGTRESVMKEVHKLLQSNGIDKADMFYTHVSFEYNLPIPAITDDTLREDELVSLTNIYATNGHIHVPMQYGDKLNTLGSFDTDRHGEEMPKGGWIFTIEDGKLVDRRFIPNKLKSTFKIIKLEDNKYSSLTNSLKKIKSVITPILRSDECIYISLRLPPKHPLLAPTAKSVLPEGNIKWKIERIKDKSKDTQSEEDESIILSLDREITKNNVLSSVNEFAEQLPLKHPVPELISELEEVLNEI